MFIPNTTVITWLLRNGKYVTIVIDNAADIKNVKENQLWFSTKIPENQSLFSAKLFPICDRPSESLNQTFMLIKNEKEVPSDQKISIEEAIQYADAVEMLKIRDQLIVDWS